MAQLNKNRQSHTAAHSVSVGDRPRGDRRKSRQRPWRRRGATAILVAVLMIIFIATAAISVDVAYMELVRGELRSSTDAAARAAVVILGETGDTAAARSTAQEIARINPVAGRALILNPEDIVFGSSRRTASGAFEFLPGVTPYRAAMVTGKKLDGEPSGAVSLFFGGIIGTPEYETQLDATAAYLDRDAVLVVDKSDSMTGTPMLDLKAAVAVFLQTLQSNGTEERVGLASYSDWAFYEHAMTTDLASVEARMNAMWTDRARTNIGGGIDMGRAILLADPAVGMTEKSMILLTDGHHNTGTDPIIAATRAASDGITIHTITFGWYADKTLMGQVAAITGGTTHHAPDGAALSNIFRDLALIRKTILTK